MLLALGKTVVGDYMNNASTIIDSLGSGPIPAMTIRQLTRSDKIVNAIPLTSRYSDPVLEEYIVQFVLSLDKETVFAFHLDPETESWQMVYDSRESDSIAEAAADEAEYALIKAANDAGYDHNNLGM